ncbi:MAG TPA: peptidoglycan-binding protein [Candidatus Paceibacterota bacterium]
MSNVTKNAISKVAAVAAGLALVASFAFVAPARAAGLTQGNIDAIINLLSSFGADSATIANVKSALTGTPVTTTTTTGGTTTASSCSFTKDLTVGAKGSDVTCLQTGLIAGGFSLPAGATGFFGSQTKAAVIAWQKATKISPASGYFGAISRAHWNLSGTTTTTGGATATSTTAVTGNGLKVALAATSPNGTALVQGQGIADLAEYTFSNPTSASINVTSLTFKRTGVSNDATLANVYLYNGVNRLTDSAGVSNSTFSFSNAAGLFTVPAGSTYTVTVRSDIAGSTAGQQIGVGLTSVGSNGTLDSSVSFPINGGLQAISAATLAGVNFETATALPTANGSLSPTADYTVWQETVDVSSNPVKLSSMKFTNLGSIDASNLQNLRLYVDGVQVGTAAAQLGADRTVTFDLSTSPVLLTTSSHIVKVLGNVTGGSNRTFQFSLQRSSDAMFVDSQLGQPVTPTANSTTFAAVSSGLQTIASVSGTSGVSVSKAAASPVNDIAVGSTNVKIASFNILASGEAVKVQDLYVYANTSVHKGGLKNGKIMVNGAFIGSTKDLGEGTSNATDFSLGSSLIIPAGTVTTVDIYADAKTSTSTNLSSNETVSVSLLHSTSNGQGQSSLNAVDVPATSDVTGNTITVTSSALTATTFSGYGNQTVLPGTSNARLGSFTLSAGSTEGVTVNTVAMNLNNAADVTNLILKDNATGAQLGSTITTPSASGNSFSVNFTIPASGTKTVDIYGNVLTTATSTAVIRATLTQSTTGTGAVTSTSASLSGTQQLQTITVGTGLLTIARSANNPVNANVIAGASQVTTSAYTFTAQNSPYTVQKLELRIPNGVATSTTGVTLSYKDVNGATQTANGAVSVLSNASSTVAFSGLSFYVPANDSADLTVLVGIPTIANGAVSGAAVRTELLNSTGFQAIDSTGNATTTVGVANTPIEGFTTGYGKAYVRKSIPTFAGQSYTSTALPTTGTDIYKFSVTADAAGAVELDKVSFNVATSTGGYSYKNYTLYDVTSGAPVALNATAVTNVNGSGIVSITPDAVIQIGAGSTKTFTLRSGSITGSAGTHNSISVQLAAADSSAVTNAAASSLTSNSYIWSDRSASNHSTTSSDWTNGYLLKNLVDGVYSFSN